MPQDLDCCFSKKKPFRPGRVDNIQRFSKISNVKNVPFFQYYNPKPDPVTKQENRKMKLQEYPIVKPKIKMKCFSCKDKKEEQIKEEEKRISKYEKPLSLRQQAEMEERHRQEKKKFYVCPKEVIRLPSPIYMLDVDPEETQVIFESVYKNEKQKIAPKKLSLTESILRYPDRTLDELLAKELKSGIVVNKSKKPKKDRKVKEVDSVCFLYDKNYRDQHKWYEMYRASDTVSLVPFAPAPSVQGYSDLEYLDEEEDEEEGLEGEYEGEDESNYEAKPEKQDEPWDLDPHMKTRKSKLLSHARFSDTEEETNRVRGEGSLSRLSAATSIDSEYRLKRPIDEDLDNASLVPNVVNRIMQKYQDSQTEICKEVKVIRRGTITSHSDSKICNLPKKFFFGVKAGTMHYGDPIFSERSRFKQGLPMCVTAYIYSFIKPPIKWTSEDINKVLDLGDKLYLKSSDEMHFHEITRNLNPEDLLDTVDFADKQIKYKIDEPDISGFTRSEDPKVFNLVKGLILFFDRNKSGIFQTYNVNILIWKHKHYYVFDPEPRTEELYSSPNGHSILANLYDIPAVASMLLNRSNIENWPFIISKISIKKVTSDEKNNGDEIDAEFREESLYKLLNPYKAIINGTISISDECFGELKNKQGFAAATIGLVYNRVTPACAWHRRIIDKIIRVANQFYIECLKDTPEADLKLENLPAFFTIGPLMFEIVIYANQFAGLMFQKSFCLFDELIRNFFYVNRAGLIEIDKYVIAVWKDRDVYYLFDPYSRDNEGLKIKNGTACVIMYKNLDGLVATVLRNFPDKIYIFKIHILKTIKINRDPEYEKYPTAGNDSEESIFESINLKDKKGYVPANITIDRTEYAIRKTDPDQPLEASILEIGSFVGSLEQKYVPVIESCRPEAIVKVIEAPIEKLVDLDSASLSDTQIEKDQPGPNREDSFEFKLIEELYRQESVIVDAQEGEDNELDYLKLLEGYDKDTDPSLMQVQDEIIQKGRDIGFIDKTDAKMNTELYGLAVMPKVVLQPNRPPKPAKKRHVKQQERIPIIVDDIRQSKELLKSSNFIQLPDGSAIIYGSTNLARFDQNYEQATPFISIAAIVMEKKYSLSTWNPEVIDSVLNLGLTLYSTVGCKFSDAPNIIIPKITLGRHDYHVSIDFLYDSLLSQAILEKCLEKFVFKTNQSAIIVMYDYSCAVFYKRSLYYLFDGFGCNLVGLGEGPDNVGVACLTRFKTLYALVHRILYNKKRREHIEPTKATRFIISLVTVKMVFPPPPEVEPRREKQLPPIAETPKPEFESDPIAAEKKQNEKEKSEKPKPVSQNKVGYQPKGKYLVIEGSHGLSNREENNGEIKACHFIGICAILGLFGRPINTWDTKRVDYIIKTGYQLFDYVDNFNLADKRNISNLLFDKYIFNIIVRRVKSDNQQISKSLKLTLEKLMLRNKFLLIQFPNCCFVLYHGKKYVHFFDPYGVETDPRCAWIKFEDNTQVINYIKQVNQDFLDLFFCYVINITELKKAKKKKRLDYELRASVVKKRKKQRKAVIFNEDEDWLLVYPVPWSRIKKQLACGKTRGTNDYLWHFWDVEYPMDLYSLTSTTHQISKIFPKKNRGKQTLANCIVSIIMSEVYNFTQWTPEVLDSILKFGDNFYSDNLAQYGDNPPNQLTEQIIVFPYLIQFEMRPLLEGTLFVVRPNQFNLSKALQFFFERFENRYGIIFCNNGTKERILAFGRVRNNEYFMFDCCTVGPPMFLDKFTSTAYILRCLTLNRLIHIMTVTLRSGDFFIFTVELTQEQTEEVVQNITTFEDKRKMLGKSEHEIRTVDLDGDDKKTEKEETKIIEAIEENEG